MLTLGIILLILGLFGVARAITLPLAAALITFGAIFAILHFAGHTVALLF
jgi:hypothetical protein